ncbi:acyl carrier protein [Streptomyces sp. NPDC047072]|uniref:acyl carrier protein n=1 Tax=Streptomyces sp. NPDC047072 TaxID=3154809 RepID=UPI0033CD9145
MPGTEHDETLARITEYLHGLGADHADIGPDTELIESGYLDSLGIVALVAFVEDTFDTEIPEDGFRPGNFTSPRAVAALVAGSRAARAGRP